MRIPKVFGERSTVKLEPKIRYFLAFEGEETEKQYFLGINRFKDELNIYNLFDIIPLERNYKERTWSSPCNCYGLLINYLKIASSEETSVETLVIHSTDYIFDIFNPKPESKLVSEVHDNLYDILSKSGFEKDSIVDDQDTVLNIICESLCNQFPSEITDISLDKLSDYIHEQMQFYDEKTDKVCLIVDRDKQSFKDYQYDKLLNACRKRQFSLYVSNPCFELWLLMHFPRIFEIERKILHKNPNVTSKKNVLEKEVNSQLPGYKKNSLPFEPLVPRINDAIKNEKSFCEDIDKLKSNLGSNVGLLIKELQNK